MPRWKASGVAGRATCSPRKVGWAARAARSGVPRGRRVVAPGSRSRSAWRATDRRARSVGRRTVGGRRPYGRSAPPTIGDRGRTRRRRWRHGVAPTARCCPARPACPADIGADAERRSRGGRRTRGWQDDRRRQGRRVGQAKIFLRASMVMGPRVWRRLQRARRAEAEPRPGRDSSRGLLLAKQLVRGAAARVVRDRG